MSSQKTRDLQWTLQAIRSGKTNLQNISFFHTQSTSGSFQESDNSSSISFSANNDDDNDGINYFNQLLAALAAAARETNHTTPMNLSFHSVDWKPGPLQNLRCLLLGKNNSNIRQLEFQRNMFGASGLSELSDMIGRNNILKVVIFSEC